MLDAQCWLEKRASKKCGHVWHIRWVDPTTGTVRSRSTKAKDKRLAQETLADKRRSLRAGVSGEVKRVRWVDFKETVMQRLMDSKAAATVRDVQITVAAFESIIKPAAPQAVKSGDILRFLAAKERAGNSPGTLDKHRRNLQWVFSEGIKAELLTTNPLKSVARIKVEDMTWHFYPPEEVEPIIEAADGKFWGPMIVLAYHTGLRKGELLNLVWDDLDLDHGRVAVTPKRADGVHLPWRSKGRALRHVPLTDRAVEWLTRMKLAADPQNAYVFIPTSRYLRLLQTPRRDVVNNFTRRWQTLCRQAEVPICQFHSLRKSCITRWAEGGVPLHVASKLAGHSSTSVTERYYTTVRDEVIELARSVSSNTAKITQNQVSERTA